MLPIQTQSILVGRMNLSSPSATQIPPNELPHFLVLMPYVPFPLNSGGAIRSFEMLVHLLHYGQVSLFCLDRRPAGKISFPLSAALCQFKVIQHNPDPLTLLVRGTKTGSLTIARWYSSTLYNEVKSELAIRHFDRLVLDHSVLLSNIPRNSSVPIILNEHNVEYGLLLQRAHASHGCVRVLWQYEATRFKSAEEDLWRKADCTLAVSEYDAECIQRAVPSAHVLIAENGVNIDYNSVTAVPENLRRVSFVGSMKYWPNRDAIYFFLNEILPIIRQSVPDISFTIAGRDLDSINVNEHTSTLELINTPDDVRPIIRQSAAVVIPLRYGSGTRLKILQAMALGRPVISTSLGAQGLRGTPGRHLLLADNPNDFAVAVVSLILDHQKSQRIADEARQLVVQRYGWETVWRTLDDYIKGSISRMLLS